jgi:hypothetical protein
MSAKKKKSQAGRPSKYRSEAARKKAKRKQDREAAKRMQERRVERYHSDPEYRAKVLAQQRARYRVSKSGDVKKFGANHGKASAYGERRRVKVRGKWKTLITLTVFELGEFMGASEKAIASWVATRKFPAPKLRSEHGDGVYGVKQANAMAKAMHTTHVGRSIFRSSDRAVIAAVHSAFTQNQP